MTRTTIDFGIDLGTTNSAVAMLHGVQTEVIKNNDGDDTTPSAIWIDKRDRLYVGRAARDRSEVDPGNTCGEFKLRMGTAGQLQRFAASGRELTPEELSAEVLKSLRADVRTRTGEEIQAAVITVPAAFDLNACDATRRAAELAGLRYPVLLQEPTAAAHAYGFQSTDDNAMWLVYDFGGGTFDAAVIQLRDGEFSVVGHAGDNFLGGKLIDWQIVEELLIPAAIEQEPSLTGLTRGNPERQVVVSKLKRAAEVAKVRLSRADSTDVTVDLSVGGELLELEYELRRQDVERLAEPFVRRSIELCRQALADCGVGPADIGKVLMVGGQTMMPFVRELVASDLGVPLEYDQDPMTVVARGAAIFAGAQPLPEAPIADAPAGSYTARFEYPRMGPDDDPQVIGRIDGPSLTGLSVEVVNAEARPPWRSGKIQLSAEGAFIVVLRAERGRLNKYQVELTDSTGARLPLSPDELRYTVGSVETQPMLTHAIGIGTADNKLHKLAERNAGLPARRAITLRTTEEVRPDNGVIRIPILEGVHQRADRNRRIGRLEVRADQVARAVPAGSELRLTIEIDISRLVRTTVYLPILDGEFEDSIRLDTEAAPVTDELETAAQVERDRLEDVRREQESVGSPLADMMLQRITDEQLVEKMENALRSAGDPAVAVEANQYILDLRVAIDAVEDELTWPALVQQAETVVAEAHDFILSHGSPSDRSELPVYERAVAEAIDSRDADLLRQRLQELQIFCWRVLDRTPMGQINLFEDLSRQRYQMTNPATADRLIRDGEEAIRTEQYERLRSINLQLSTLIPAAPTTPDSFSTVELAPR